MRKVFFIYFFFSLGWDFKKKKKICLQVLIFFFSPYLSCWESPFAFCPGSTMGRSPPRHFVTGTSLEDFTLLPVLMTHVKLWSFFYFVSVTAKIG